MVVMYLCGRTECHLGAGATRVCERPPLIQHPGLGTAARGSISFLIGQEATGMGPLTYALSSRTEGIFEPSNAYMNVFCAYRSRARASSPPSKSPQFPSPITFLLK